IKSALLELHHEVERPLDRNHAECAAFGRSDNDYARWSYIEKLKRAVQKSIELWERFCNEGHIELNLKEAVEVEVHGFYELEYKGIATSIDKMPAIRLWSTKSPLKRFIVKGP